MRRPIPEYKRMNINSVHRFVLGGKFIYIVSRSIVSNYNDTNNAKKTRGLNHAIRLHSLSMHGMDARCRVCLWSPVRNEERSRFARAQEQQPEQLPTSQPPYQHRISSYHSPPTYIPPIYSEACLGRRCPHFPHERPAHLLL